VNAREFDMLRRISVKVVLSDGACPQSLFQSAVVLILALFTRTWCFHHDPSTTSSATRATKLL
jgi:hypothetical protein